MSAAPDRPARAANLDLLAVYLRDHVTGATAGLELVERAAREQRGTPAGDDLARLAREIGEDREAYKALMADLGVEVGRAKVALAWLGEKVTRLKANGRLVRRSPLSDVVELEAMHLGVTGKLAGWHTLRLVAEHDDRLDGTRLAALAERAVRQAEDLERLRRDAVRRLVTPGDAAGPSPAAG